MTEAERFEEFFRLYYDKQLREASKKTQSFIEIDFNDLDKFDPLLADKLLNDPCTILEEVRQAIQEIDLPEGQLKLEPRFKNLPDSSSVRIRELRSDHIGKFIMVDGVVRRASEVKPEISVIVFQCIECGSKIEVKQTERIVRQPTVCDCGRKASFKEISRKLFDSRWVTLEEPFETSTGERPGEISIYLKNDLTSPEMQRKTDPGNRLKITGIIRELRKFSRGRMKTQMDIFMEANHTEPAEIEWEGIEVTPEEEQKIKEFANNPNIYEKLVNSMAPSIFGLNEIKRAIILQLFGGVQHIFPDKTRVRGDIHILLLGDPSTAKSQLLKLVSNIIPRGKYASGGGVTGTGLTCTVYKDEEFVGGWVLEAGALVLANKGVMCIDEFDKIPKEDQSRLHEALEQQTISIAKASIVATLPAQVSVLAGANPKFSRFDPYKPIAQQIMIPDTLLSRFDLKFALRDVPEKERDEKLATHIMETRLTPDKIEPEISPNFLRKYIAYARKNCKPEITKEAAERLKKFYVDMRGMYVGEDVVPITLRQNEALIRLAESSAKIRLSKKVTVEDAERSIQVMMCSLKQLGYDTETEKFDIDRVEAPVSSSQRTKINAILDIIDNLTKQIGKQIPREEILISAKEEGVKESDADELLNRLKHEGFIFEPKQGFVQKV